MAYQPSSTWRLRYLSNCFVEGIFPSMVMGGILHGVQDVALYGGRPSLRGWGTYSAFLYVYRSTMCPMEAIQGRESLLHNGFAGGILGYAGVQRGLMAIPFVDSSFFYRYPQVPPAVVGGVVYGGIAIAFGSFSGKRI
mmetsp:Transcript_2380/g.4678  ORF Transcript_2380/g.4678 Transcript_2380/m.4678 type:complete len:138 (-) Transcript_2380:251-664(-)